MKKATVKEVKEKIERIMELEKRGFNVPRFCFVIHQAPEDIINKSLEWAKEVHEQNPEQIFNIRTYAYNEKSKNESISTPHLTDITFELLKFTLININKEFSCMIDAETPDNGRMAGNVTIIEKKGFISRNLEFHVDYCSKEKRAMVRDADRYFSGTTRGKLIGKDTNPKEVKILTEVVNRAIDFHKIKKNFILEWTCFCKPAGIKREPIVWWEYRKYE